MSSQLYTRLAAGLIFMVMDICPASFLVEGVKFASKGILSFVRQEIKALYFRREHLLPAQLTNIPSKRAETALSIKMPPLTSVIQLSGY